MIYRQPYSNELMHYGVMGMKWGVRRYQNPDGTLTNAGRKRYGYAAANQIAKRAIKESKTTLEKQLKADYFNNAKKYVKNSQKEAKTSNLAKQAKYEQKSHEALAKMLNADCKLNKFYSMDEVDQKTVAEGYDAILRHRELFDTTVSMAVRNTMNAQKYLDEKLGADVSVHITTLDGRDNSRRETTIGSKNETQIVERPGDEFFDKNKHYGWDHDGNPIYNKSDAQVTKERTSNPKLRDMTDKQYKAADRDLNEIATRRYASQPLSVRQKIIKDYASSGGQTKDFNSYGHGPRPTNQQTLRNQYDTYLNDHPNSELTFNEFNNWFYEG